MSNEALRAAVAAAVPEAQAALEAPAAPEGVEGTPAKGEATTPAGEATPTSKEVGSEVVTEVPQTLFGLDLSVLPDDEARQKFIDEFTETNKTIGKLQREKAEALAAVEAAKTPPVASEPTVEVSSITDAQIAQALGINLEESIDPARDQRDIALTRTLLEQEERLAKMESSVQSSTQSSTWDKAFSALEASFGPLPEDTTREDVLAYARENGIASPEAAYWAAVGPIRATVASALEKRLSELKTSGKKGATTVRPSGSVGVDEAKLTSTNVKDAMKEAFEKARVSLGIKEMTP